MSDRMTNLKDTSLTLFFTRRVGLHHWDAVGNLEREVELYRRLAAHLGVISFVTYGGRTDMTLAARLSPLRVLSTPGRLPTRISQHILRSRHGPALSASDVFKTNQIPGAEVAIWAKRKYGKRLIVRCGYLHSQFVERQTREEWRIRRAYALERMAFLSADAGVVTSERDLRWVVDQYGVDPAKMHVIPNYVVTEIFRPMPDIPKVYDLVCVAKAARQKNLGALLEALGLLEAAGEGKTLLLIGSAAADGALRDRAARLRLQVTFRDRVANYELPSELARARAFILPSLYEGHPKTLLEAMSCGLPCIGSDVIGVRDCLDHGQTGHLCGTDPEAIASAIRTVLASQRLMQETGRKARAYVQRTCSLQSVLDRELRLLQSTLDAGRLDK